MSLVKKHVNKECELSNEERLAKAIREELGWDKLEKLKTKI